MTSAASTSRVSRRTCGPASTASPASGSRANWGSRCCKTGSRAVSPCSGRSAPPAGSSCATSSWKRGRGLGGILWQHVTARLRDLAYTLLVFDVEDPDGPGCGEAEVRLRNRRVAFYLRQGAQLLPVSGYRTPHGSEEDPGWTPMRLMSAPLTAGRAVKVVPA